jgi:hypothetical protein
MSSASTGWEITMKGCQQVEQDCDSARFEVKAPKGEPVAVEVRTTAQVEHILARELGKEALSAGDREAILTVAGRWLIEELVGQGGAVGPLLLLDSRLFQVPGAERRLLQECGLVSK